MENWLAEGQLKNFGRSKHLLDAKFLGASILDAINLGLCIKAVVDAKDGAEYRTAMFGGVAAGDVARRLHRGSSGGEGVDQGLGDEGARSEACVRRSQGRHRRLLRHCQHRRRGECLSKGRQRQGCSHFRWPLPRSSRRSSGANLGRLRNRPRWSRRGSSFVAGAVAAAAYITATYVTDHPLEKFLEYCEWGKDRYGELLYEAKWSDGPVSTWQSSYPKQARMLLRVLLRLTASWDFQAMAGDHRDMGDAGPGHARGGQVPGADVGRGRQRNAGLRGETVAPQGPPSELKVKPKKDFKNVPGNPYPGRGGYIQALGRRRRGEARLPADDGRDRPYERRGDPCRVSHASWLGCRLAASSRARRKTRERFCDSPPAYPRLKMIPNHRLRFGLGLAVLLSLVGGFVFPRFVFSRDPVVELISAFGDGGLLPDGRWDRSRHRHQAGVVYPRPGSRDHAGTGSGTIRLPRSDCRGLGRATVLERSGESLEIVSELKYDVLVLGEITVGTGDVPEAHLLLRRDAAEEAREDREPPQPDVARVPRERSGAAVARRPRIARRGHARGRPT